MRFDELTIEEQIVYLFIIRMKELIKEDNHTFYDFNLTSDVIELCYDRIIIRIQEVLDGKTSIEQFKETVDIYFNAVFQETKMRFDMKLQALRGGTKEDRERFEDVFIPKAECDFINGRAVDWFDDDWSYKDIFYRYFHTEESLKQQTEKAILNMNKKKRKKRIKPLVKKSEVEIRDELNMRGQTFKGK